MVVNLDTWRGIPLGHSIGGTTSADVRDFVLFVQRTLANNGITLAPSVVVIDKDVTELRGLEDARRFSAKQFNVMLCSFHVQQALLRWMKKHLRNIPLDIREKVEREVTTTFQVIQTAWTKEKVLRCQQTLYTCLGRVEGTDELVSYLRREWFDSDDWKGKFSLSSIVSYRRMFTSVTNNFIESWHNLLKGTTLRGRKNKRVDDLVAALVVGMESELYRALNVDDSEKKKLRLFMTERMTQVTSAMRRGEWKAQADKNTARLDGKVIVSRGKDSVTVGLKVEGGQCGPQCPCPDTSVLLCKHILSAVCIMKYTTLELAKMGWQHSSQTGWYCNNIRGVAPTSSHWPIDPPEQREHISTSGTSLGSDVEFDAGGDDQCNIDDEDELAIGSEQATEQRRREMSEAVRKARIDVMDHMSCIEAIFASLPASAAAAFRTFLRNKFSGVLNNGDARQRASVNNDDRLRGEQRVSQRPHTREAADALEVRDANLTQQGMTQGRRKAERLRHPNAHVAFNYMEQESKREV